MAIDGYCTPKENGDQYATGYDFILLTTLHAGKALASSFTGSIITGCPAQARRTVKSPRLVGLLRIMTLMLIRTDFRAPMATVFTNSQSLFQQEA